MIDDSSLTLYTRTAELAANQVIDSYSTSFGLACRLLGARHRQHVRNIYALVRIADELVDGMTAAAGLEPAAQSATLERMVDETHLAMQLGCSSDLIVHAFARTARAVEIDESLTRPFFASMRTDLRRSASVSQASAGTVDPAALAYFSSAQHSEYVYGSAEAVGLMCLRVFLQGQVRSDADLATLTHGARQLGAAFQNINFLRDLSDDTSRLGRSYLTGSGGLTEADRGAWVAVIRAQLADADAAIPLLPRDARAAVRSARALFGAPTDRIATVSIDELYARRIRVPNPVKAALATAALAKTALESGA